MEQSSMHGGRCRLPAPSIPMPPPIPTTSHHHAPLLLALSLIFHFSMTFSRYQFSDKILEISLVFTHGITPAWVNHNRCFVKKCILMFRAMHENLACNYITQITRRKWHLFDTSTLTWPRKSLAKVNTIILIARCKRLSTCPKSRVAHTHSVSQNLSHTHTSYVTPT